MYLCTVICTRIAIGRSKIEKIERVRGQTLARQNVLTCYRNDKHVGKREFTWSETWQRQREITRSSMLTVPCDLYKAGYHTRSSGNNVQRLRYCYESMSHDSSFRHLKYDINIFIVVVD